MSILSSLFGDDDFADIDNRIDALIGQFPMINHNNQIESSSGDFVSSFIDSSSKSEIDKLLQTAGVSRDRLERYNIYDETYKYVPIIKRMLKVYIANILQKNPVTGKCLFVKENIEFATQKNGSEIDNVKKSKQFTESCIKSFNLLTKLRGHILPLTLIYGDCFIEVVDINQETKKKESGSTLSMMPLFEAELRGVDNELSQLQSRRDKNGFVYDQIDQILSKLAKYFCEISIIDEKSLEDDQNKDLADKKQETQITTFDDVLLKIHKPHNIIILQTEYGTILGYLEVIKNETPQVYNLTQTLSTLVGRITSILGRDISSQENITDRLVRYIVKQILEKAGTKTISGTESIDDILRGLDPQVYTFIKRLIVEQGLNQKNLQNINRVSVRFIPVSRMVSFSLLSSEYSPYGESFIDPLVFQSKLYILSQLSNVIMKLSRAAPVRKWTIDVGSTQMQPGLIQKLKRELYNTRVTVDDLATFKNIPKILSDFKDMFVLSKSGNKPIDVEISSHGDPTVRIADLQDARQEIMSLSGIPPAYLGYADVIELREQLVHTNVAFATEIIDIQENISNGLTKIIDIIAQIKGFSFNPSMYTQVMLIPPITLILQLIEMSLSSIGNISGIFQTLQMPIDPYFFLQQYIPYINWEEFKEKTDQYALLQQTKAKVDSLNPDGASYR